MFGIPQIIRHYRRWHASHRRAAMERAMLDLPLDLRKDLGWPSPRDGSSASAASAASPVRRMQ